MQISGVGWCGVGWSGETFQVEGTANAKALSYRHLSEFEEQQGGIVARGGEQRGEHEEKPKGKENSKIRQALRPLKGFGFYSECDRKSLREKSCF